MVGACARYVFVEERLRSSESTFYTPDCNAIARRQSTSSLLCSSSRLAFLVEVWVRHYLGVEPRMAPAAMIVNAGTAQHSPGTATRVTIS